MTDNKSRDEKLSEPVLYGIQCWYHPECRASFDVELDDGAAPDWEAIHDEAGKLGWVIGHYDGQGHYACPTHAETLFDPTPLVSHKTFLAALP